MYVKTIVRFVFVISGITKISVSAISLSLQLWLITVTDNGTKIFEIDGLSDFRYEALLARHAELWYYLLAPFLKM